MFDWTSSVPNIFLKRPSISPPVRVTAVSLRVRLYFGFVWNHFPCFYYNNGHFFIKQSLSTINIAMR